MAKGAIAKAWVGEMIQSAFDTNYVGESAGKYYVTAMENGLPLQVCISLTIPKTPLTTGTTTVKDYAAGAFGGSDDADNVNTVTAPPPAEFSEEERDNIAKLMEKLGL